MTTDAETLVPMADLATEWGVTSNTVSRRLSFLGIKPIRQGNFRFLTAEQKALGDQLQDHVLSGKPMEAFPRPDGDSSQVVRRVSSQVTPQVAAQVEMAAAIAAALQPPADPLKRAKGLGEAADHQLVLPLMNSSPWALKALMGLLMVMRLSGIASASTANVTAPCGLLNVLSVSKR